jgi:hypothetical protein
MKNDMAKQITECYRYKYENRGGHRSERRRVKHHLNNLDVEWDDEDNFGYVTDNFSKITRSSSSIRDKAHMGRESDFGENLNPLFRFLDGQVGRPWDDVYSEIKNAIPNGTMGDHVLIHVFQHVSTDHQFNDNGKPVSYHYTKYSGPREVYGLYVDPSGIIRNNAAPKRINPSDAVEVSEGHVKIWTHNVVSNNNVLPTYHEGVILNDEFAINVNGTWRVYKKIHPAPFSYTYSPGPRTAGSGSNKWSVSENWRNPTKKERKNYNIYDNQ